MFALKRQTRANGVEYQSAESDQCKQLIQHLAVKWAKVKLADDRFLYQDYIRIISRLFTATQSKERTEYLFMAILNQAVQLGKTSQWVEREIRFETLAYATDRSELSLIYLKHSAPIDDAALDAYNERIKRFSLPSQSTSTQD